MRSWGGLCVSRDGLLFRSARPQEICRSVRVCVQSYAFGADTQFSTIAKHPQARHELLRHLGPDILNEQELRKRTAYISFSYTLRDAWEQDLRPLAADASDADQRFEALCCALSEIDVTDLRNAYRETEIF